MFKARHGRSQGSLLPQVQKHRFFKSHRQFSKDMLQEFYTFTAVFVVILSDHHLKARDILGEKKKHNHYRFSE